MPVKKRTPVKKSPAKKKAPVKRKPAAKKKPAVKKPLTLQAAIKKQKKLLVAAGPTFVGPINYRAPPAQLNKAWTQVQPYGPSGPAVPYGPIPNLKPTLAEALNYQKGWLKPVAQKKRFGIEDSYKSYKPRAIPFKYNVNLKAAKSKSRTKTPQPVYRPIPSAPEFKLRPTTVRKGSEGYNLERLFKTQKPRVTFKTNIHEVNSVKTVVNSLKKNVEPEKGIAELGKIKAASAEADKGIFGTIFGGVQSLAKNSVVSLIALSYFAQNDTVKNVPSEIVKATIVPGKVILGNGAQIAVTNAQLEKASSVVGIVEKLPVSQKTKSLREIEDFANFCLAKSQNPYV